MEDLLDELFESMGVECDKHYDEDGIPSYTYELEEGDFFYSVWVFFNKKIDAIHISIKGPIWIREENRPKVAEYLARVNLQGYEGSLKMVYEEGYVCYSYVLRYSPEFDCEQIRFQLFAGLEVGASEVGRHFPHIHSIEFDGVSPTEAYLRADFNSNDIRLN